MADPSKQNDWLDDSIIHINDYELDDEWKLVFQNEFEKEYFKNLQTNLTKETDTLGKYLPTYPPKHEIFKTFELCPPNEIKIVILGQGISPPF